MATFRQLPSGKWNVQVRLAGKKPISSTHSTRELAEAWACEQEREIQKVKNTVELLTPVYLSEVMIRNGKKRGGYDSIENRLTVIARNLRVTAIAEISKEDVVAYRVERLKAVQGSTVRLEIQLLSRLLRWANEEKGIECSDVTKGVKLPEAGKAREKVIEPLELEMILDHAPERARDFIRLAYETAMRRNELLAVTPAMVNLKKRIISLSGDQTKNGCSRDVPLTKKAVAILERLCDGRDKKSKLFDYSPYGITQAFRRAARLAGVTNVCLHSCRHSAITNAADKGLNVVQLMSVSGHRSISMLARYSHLKASKVAELLD
ncbi:site-specific integrase [Escherichia coli]|nr:site-specific integrase [Escherichia coli]